MKQYTYTFVCYLSAILLLGTSCRKEETLNPTGLDENYFVNKDNPNDPVDHAIFQFFESTGIPCFYNDTIYKKQVGDNNGTPIYSYIRLSLHYRPYGNKTYVFEPLATKNRIPALLHLLRNEVINKLPEDYTIRCFYFVNNYKDTIFPLINIKIPDGQSACIGFNTVGIKTEEVEAMNSDEKRMYAASILAGLAEQWLTDHSDIQLQRDFYSITIAATSHLPLRGGVYAGLPFWISIPVNTIPPPESLGFLRYIDTDFIGMPISPYIETPPRQNNDIRAYLTAAFYYTPQELNTLYADAPLILTKFNVLLKLAKDAGFKLPE